MGIEDSAEFPTTTVEVPGSEFAFFCYTDGIIEAMNPEGEMFGMDRLREALADRHDLNPQALVKQVRKSVASFVGEAHQSDDITILAATVR